MRNCDKLHLCDHLVLNEGAYFYKKNELEVGKDRIQEVFNSVLTEIEYELFTNLLFFACFQIRNLPLFFRF